MGRLFALVVACAVLPGCRQLAGLDDPLAGDGSVGTPDGTDANPPVCYGAGLVKLCLPAPATGAIVLASPINTDTSPLCSTDAIGATGLCVVVGATIAIEDGATVRGTGTRPLVLLAGEAVTIAGTLDVASRRQSGRGAGGNFAGCQDPDEPPAGGGGGGGSFGGRGGDGGAPGTNRAGNVLPAPTALHGGCRGADGGEGTTGDPGKRGDGGGAVYLLAGDQITVTGTINASGAGGDTVSTNTAGGGGGGSGGMIGLEAPMLEVAGAVFANGGGGSEGSDGTVAGVDGADPTDGAVAAGGGDGASTGGAGGSGAAGATVTGGGGGAGAVGASGGGGGGGGAGLIKLVGTRTGSGLVSPPPT